MAVGEATTLTLERIRSVFDTRQQARVAYIPDIRCDSGAALHGYTDPSAALHGSLGNEDGSSQRFPIGTAARGLLQGLR